MFIGTAAAMFRAAGGRRLPATIVLLALGAYGIHVTSQRSVFADSEGERRYATIAQLVAGQTEPSAMILASIHAGSLRYYGGRATLRFDLLDEEWLDRSVAWLNAHGRHPYLLVESWEMPAFRMRFAKTSALGDLRLTPGLAYRGYGSTDTVYLFDLLHADRPTIAPLPIRDANPRCPPPAPPPAL